MAEITDAEIADLRRLCEAATPGPWESQYARDGHTAREINRQFSGSFVCAVAPRQQVRSHHDGGVFPSADQELIAAARNALPGLLSRLERAERERDGARQVLDDARRAADLPRAGECEFEGRDRMAAFLGMVTLHKAGIATFHDEDACEVYIAQWLANRGRKSGSRIATLEAALRDICDHGLECWLGSDRNRSCVAIAEAALRGVEGKPAEAIAKEAADAAE